MMPSVSSLMNSRNLSTVEVPTMAKNMLVMYTSLASGYLTLQTEAVCVLTSTDSISYDRIMAKIY